MCALLLVAAGLYLLLGEPRESLSLVVMVLVVLGLTLYQEGKTERAIQALRDLSSPRARVVRDGRAQHIAGMALVRGDILLLAEGDRIAADAELLSGSGLQVDESLLTGESVPVHKLPRLDAAATPGGEDSCALFSGTLVVQGQGVARVTAPGPRSQMGQIGTALRTLQTEMAPRPRQTARLGRAVAGVACDLSVVRD